MRKNLLLGIALLASAATSAQSIYWPCTVTRADGTINISATNDGASSTIKASDATPGEDFKALTNDDGTGKTTAIKDQTGANINFPDDTYAMIGWHPITGNSESNPETNAAEAETAGCYVDFTIEEEDVNKDLTGLKSVSFTVSKVGTDAVKMNCRLLGEGDGNISSDFLINAENALTMGDEYKETDNSKAAPWNESANGYNPSRNDGSKGASGGANSTGVSNVKINIPAEIIAKNPYKLTLRLVGILIANNKQLAFNNVSFNFGETIPTGIQTIKSEKASNVIYNVAGQQVDSNYKGLVIKNGRKMIQK